MKGEFYKMEFEAWDEGTFDLTLEEEAAYLRICHQMYRRGGPIQSSTRLLCAIFRCHHVKALALLKRLVAAGKIGVTPEGFLTNNRVATELEAREKVRASRQQAGQKGGTRSAEARAKSLENNDQDQANASQAGKQIQPEERRGEKNTPIVPKGTKGAEPEGFAEWFAAYPKRDGANPRAPAATRFASAIKAGATPETLLRAVQAYAAELGRKGKLGTEYVKQAQFWLSPNDRLWEHYGQQAQAAEQRAAAADVTAGWSEDRWREEVRRWASRGGHWMWRSITPPPDDPNTKVPRHILAELNIHPARARAA